jgi:DNA-3-methyladenine glycosylase II
MLIDSETALDEGLTALLNQDKRMRKIMKHAGRPPLRKREPGFPGLVAIIVSQQVSTASAAAIWKRVSTHYPKLSARQIAMASNETLQSLGLSGPKIRTLRAVADAITTRSLSLTKLHTLSAEEAIAMLTTVKGIGPWTAEIYLLFCLGHSDAFPAGDLALQEAARIAFDLKARPSAPELVTLAEAWRPWRGVAAKLLWAYYGAIKSGKEAVPQGIEKKRKP